MLLAAIPLLALCLPLVALAQGPTVGERAPAFSLAGSDGKVHALADFAGKQGVVLAWFPKAFTGG